MRCQPLGTRCRVTPQTHELTLESEGFGTLTVCFEMWVLFWLSASSGPFVCLVLMEVFLLCTSRIRLDMRDACPRSGQIRLLVRRFVCPVLVEALLCESRTRLDLRSASPRSGQKIRFHVGRWSARCIKKFCCVRAGIGLDVRVASPCSAQSLPCGPFVCPVLVEVGKPPGVRQHLCQAQRGCTTFGL